MSDPGDPFAREGRGIREILQSVEDALTDACYDDFVVATEHGSWYWRTVERARADGKRCWQATARLRRPVFFALHSGSSKSILNGIVEYWPQASATG